MYTWHLFNLSIFFSKTDNNDLKILKFSPKTKTPEVRLFMKDNARSFIELPYIRCTQKGLKMFRK